MSIRIFLYFCFFFISSAAHACLTEEREVLSYKCKQEPGFHGFLRALFPDAAKPLKIAVIAGVANYPNLPKGLQLPYAAHDVKLLKSIFSKKLDFDEIIVIEDSLVTKETLIFLFENYIPSRIDDRKGSSVVFAFSGHGADYKNFGYIFEHDTKSLEINNFSESQSAIRLGTLKAAMEPTLATSHHFLALINSCKGGHFLTDRGAAFGSAFDESGAHGITAGGANEFVYARDNVGSGMGSVFFEMVDAAFSNSKIVIGTKEFSSPAADDGIVTASELAQFLTKTIRWIENNAVTPRFERLVRPAKGRQGEAFFVTDKVKAGAFFSEKFPESYKRIFGGPSETAGLRSAEDLVSNRLINLKSLLNLSNLKNARENGTRFDDWIAYSPDLESGQFCFLFSDGVSSINSLIESGDSTLEKLLVYRDGTRSRLVVTYDRANGEYHVSYVNQDFQSILPEVASGFRVESLSLWPYDEVERKYKVTEIGLTDIDLAIDTMSADNLVRITGFRDARNAMVKSALDRQIEVLSRKHGQAQIKHIMAKLIAEQQGLTIFGNLIRKLGSPIGAGVLSSSMTPAQTRNHIIALFEQQLSSDSSRGDDFLPRATVTETAMENKVALKTARSLNNDELQILLQNAEATFRYPTFIDRASLLGFTSASDWLSKNCTPI